MIYWHGKSYPLVTHPYNGAVLWYLLDGLLLDIRPNHTRVRGHIITDEGVVIILGRELSKIFALLFLIGVTLLLVFWPRYEYSYYQVTFAERPVLDEGVLYCNVVNEADIEVTVQFLDSRNKTTVYTLSPGDTLPYIYIDFVPSTIRYNGKSDFPLEVRND